MTIDKICRLVTAVQLVKTDQKTQKKPGRGEYFCVKCTNTMIGEKWQEQELPHHS